MKLDNGRSFQNNLFYEQKAFHVTVRWLVKGKYSLTGQIRIGKRDTSVGSVQIHAVHTISQGALQNTDTIPVKFPNILPKQIRIKDIVLHGVGKRTQFSRYITLTIFLGIGRFFLVIKTLSELYHFLITIHPFLRATCNNCMSIKQCVYLQITIK